MASYLIQASVNMCVECVIEAESEHEARKIFGDINWSLDANDSDIDVEEASANDSDIEELKDLDMEKWDNLTAHNKVKFLTENGVDEKEAVKWVAEEGYYDHDILEVVHEHIHDFETSV